MFSPSSYFKTYYLLLLLALLLLSACGGRGGATPVPVNVAELNLTPPSQEVTIEATETPMTEGEESEPTTETEATPEPTATAIIPTSTAAVSATVAVSDSNTPTVTVPVSPTVTVVPSPVPATAVPTRTPTPLPPCTQTLDPLEQDALSQAPGLHCPAGEGETLYTASQPFEHGRMIWLSNEARIYVLYNDGRWQAFEDTFAEGEPELDSTLLPPDGLLQPVRGFGKIWREALGGADAQIGWGLAPEKGLNATVQPWQGGIIITYAIDDRIAILADGGWQTLE